MKRIAKRLRLALLLAAAAALGFGAGWLLGPVETALVTSAPPEEDAMETFRREREQLRAMERAQLSEIAHDPDSGDEIAGMARRRLMEEAREQEAETELEGMLRLRGYADCIVCVNGGSVNVLVRTEMLTRQESAMILELACRETGVQSGNVKIIPIK